MNSPETRRPPPASLIPVFIPMQPLYRICALLLASLASLCWAAGPAAPGVPNFHQVNDQVYRGGQPAGESWTSLARLGIKTVIDLRRAGEHSTSLEEKAVLASGMRYVNVPMNGIIAPSDEAVSRVLSLLDSTSAGPTFVHCRRGADRTGTVIACYRIAHDQWPNSKALNEAKSYGMSWMEFGMKNYVRAFHPAAIRAAAQPATLP
jgi:tyrosine-protein phosphatase SIW14